MIVGIIKNADSCASLADAWARGGVAGAGVVVAPPATPEDIDRQAGLIVVESSGDALAACVAALRPVLTAGSAVVCTAPDASLAALRALSGPVPALFRAIIPLGAEPGEGVVALAAEPGTDPQTVTAAKDALAWIGNVEVMGEDALDAVAALSMGGAALLCEALQGLEDGATGDGLPRETARAFTHHTALATALLLCNHAGSPADLKDQVASPGGTTIAALASLEDAGVRGAYLRAVQRTTVEVRRRRDAARQGVIE